MITKFKIYENNDSDIYIYHGTGKGQALRIQMSGYMITNDTGDEKPSISFTNNIDYAKYYAKYKGGKDKMVILRTKLNDKFKISNKIRDNKGEEYVTFEEIPSSELEILTNSGWVDFNSWNIIFDEPK